MRDTYPRDYAFPFTPNMANVGAYVLSSSGLDFAVSNESIDDSAGEDYRWHSPHLQNIKNEEELINKARALLAIFNGAQKLTASISQGDIILSRPPEANLRIPHSLDFDFTINPFSPDMDKWVYNIRHNPFSCDLDYCLFLSRYDETVRGMLSFLGVNSTSWVSLYALIDFIKMDLQRSGAKVSDTEIAALGKVSTAQLGLFKHTANNYTAIGPLCRHGDQGLAPPPNPMSFVDASELVLKIFMEFLKLREDDAKIKYKALTFEESSN